MKTKSSKIFFAYLPSFLWAGIIFIFSSQSSLASLDLSILDFIFKKSAHMFVYFVLYFLLYRAISKTVNQKYQKHFWIFTFILCLVYAFSDEFHQSLVPGRQPTFRDVGYDSLGMLLAFSRIYHYI